MTDLAGLSDPPHSIGVEASLCFLAQAFAESNVYAIALRPDGSPVRLCWHRIKNIFAACDALTQKDIDAARRSLQKFPGIVV